MGKINTRAPMTIKMRAKQFAMFDALKGLQEAIAEEELVTEPRRYLSKERIDEINACLISLQIEENAKIVYYRSREGRYLQLDGHVVKVDPYRRNLQINDITIDFSDIVEIIPNS